MTDYSRDRLGPDDEDRLPWLEPVEEEVEEGGIVSGRLIMWLAIGLFVVLAIAGAFFWMRNASSGGAGNGELIQAPDSYYKERPADAAPVGDDEIVYSASKGNEIESVIDTSGTAETPVNIDGPLPATEPAPAVPPPTATRNVPAAAASQTATPTAPKAAEARPRPAPAPAPAAASAASPVAGSGTVQLGAFSTQAKANSAWKNLAGRFSFLAGLTQSVVPVQSGDRTLYRLRASGGNAADICGRLRTAGESCSVVG